MAVHTGASLTARRRSLLRHSAWDAVLVGLAIAHGAALLAAPSIPLVAIGLWWNANTIAHNFIHTPVLPRARAQPAVLHLPERGARHSADALARRGTCSITRPASSAGAQPASHRRDRRRRVDLGCDGGVRAGLLLRRVPSRAMRSVSASAICRDTSSTRAVRRVTTDGCTTSASSTTATTSSIIGARASTGPRLPRHAGAGAQRSGGRRCCAGSTRSASKSLERVVLRSPCLQRFVLATHERALATLLAAIPPSARVTRVTIVGGGLFPAHGADSPAAAARRGADHRRRSARAHRDRADVSWRRRVDYRRELLRSGRPGRCRSGRDSSGVHRRSPARLSHPPHRRMLVHDWMWRPARRQACPSRGCCSSG